MAFTLVDYLKIAKTSLRAGVIKNLLRYSDLIGLVPFENVDALKILQKRWKTLPDVSWRDIGGAFGTGTGQTEDIEEALYDIGHNIDIDKAFMRAKAVVVDPMQLQINMVTQSISYEFNDKVINGSPVVDAKAVWGLKYRVGLLPASQTIYGDAAGNGTGAETRVLASSANMQWFLDQLDNLIDAVGGAPAEADPVVTALLMNKKTYQGVRSIMRRQKLLDVTQDQFGRRINSYMGVRLIDVGLKKDKSTEIITNTEDPGDGGSDSSSVYAVRIGSANDEAFTGIQLFPLETNDIGLLEAGNAFRVNVDWMIGFLGLSDYYAARLQGFLMAA